MKEKLVVKKVLYTPIAESMITDGDITDISGLASQFRQTLRKNKIKARNCFCCFQSDEIITREVTIPSPDKNSLQEMAKFEVEQYLPVEMSNYVVQSLVLKEIEIDDKPFAEMQVTAFPKRFVDQLYRLINQAGLYPVVLDTQANAFRKLIENQYKINGNDYHREGTSAFIDFGYENVSISIFQKGKFKFNRVLKVGGKDLDINISKFLDISIDEAEKRKLQIHNINYTVDEFTENSRMINVVKSTMENWFDEIAKIFRYFNAKTSGTGQVEYIYIYGGGAKINGLDDYVESYFKVPVSSIRKVSNVSLSDNADLDTAELLNAFGVMYRR